MWKSCKTVVRTAIAWEQHELNKTMKLNRRKQEKEVNAERTKWARNKEVFKVYL